MTGARVLVIDDDGAILRAVRRALEVHGFAVETLQVLAPLSETIRRARPELVLLDLVLPDGDGMEALRTLRELTDPPPVIVLSALGDEARKVQALDLGADDYVTKPFGIEELLARMRVALRRRGTDASRPLLVCGPIALDLERREVHVGGILTRLTPTEFDLLRLLVQEQGRVLTQHTILSRVWGPEYVEDTHVLRTFIHQLRQKLAAAVPEAAAMLVTDPGVGYRLDPPV